MFYILNDEHNLSLFDDIQEKIEGTKEFMPQLATAEIQETDIITEEQLSKDLNQVIVEEYEEEVIIDDEPVTVTKYRLALNPDYPAIALEQAKTNKYLKINQLWQKKD